MCSFFFFFKQKTAYEMRISDWSSDVCSSDLSHHPGLVITVNEDCFMKLATLKDGSRDGRLVVVSKDLRHAVDAKPFNTMQQALENWSQAEPVLSQIGSASCRERVCQYV